jgi:DNA-binding transcriptional regulator GbsR (MarR family)
MPAIASLEDLKAAQKKGGSIYAMLYLSSKAETIASEDALCSMLYGNGAG